MTQTDRYAASAAVMARRRKSKTGLDYYPTPGWATRALFTYVLQPRGIVPRLVWEPAAGGGHMARVLREYAPLVRETDIHDYGRGIPRVDFLSAAIPRGIAIITNPPFKLADEFASHALNGGAGLVALLVRTAFLEGAGRYDNLWRHYPDFVLSPFVTRLGMTEHATARKVASATSYSWVVWAPGRITSSTVVHIPPEARPRLERAQDYDVEAPDCIISCVRCESVWLPRQAADREEAVQLARAAGWHAASGEITCPACVQMENDHAEYHTSGS